MNNGNGVKPVKYEAQVFPYLFDLKRYCFHLTHSAWDGEDLYQQTLLNSYRYFLSAGSVQDKHFLFRVAKNVRIDQYRGFHRRRNTVLHEVYEAEIPQASASDYIEIYGIIEWLAQILSARSLDMWLLSKYFGYSMKEISEFIGCTESAVKSALFRTRQILRTSCLSSDGKGRSKMASKIQIERWVRAVMKEDPFILQQSFS